MSLLFLIVLNINITPFWHPKSVMNNDIYVSIWLPITSAGWQKEMCAKIIATTETNYNLHIHDTFVTPSEKRVSSFQG